MGEVTRVLKAQKESRWEGSGFSSGRWCLVDRRGSQLEEKEGGGKTGLKNVASSGDAAVGTERGRTMTGRD